MYKNHPALFERHRSMTTLGVESFSFAVDVLGAEEAARLVVVESGALPRIVAADGRRLDGLTMRVVNPEYLVRRREYAAIVRELQTQARARDRASTWLNAFERVPARGCFTVPRDNDVLEDTETEIVGVLLETAHVAKPDSVRDERNESIRRALLVKVGAKEIDEEALALSDTANVWAAVRALPKDANDTPLFVQGPLPVFARVPTGVRTAEQIDEANVLLREWITKTSPQRDAAFIDAFVARAQLASEPNAIIRALVDGVRNRFRAAIRHYDWSESAVTLDELKVLFIKYLDDERSGAPLTDVREYRRAIVHYLPVREMSGAWLLDYEASNRDADVFVRRVKSQLETDANNEDVGRRSQEMITYARERTTELVRAVRETIRLEVELQALVPTPTLDERLRLELRALQAARVYSIDPTEEMLRVRRLRLRDAARFIHTETEARLARARAQLARMPPVIDVPLVVERDVNDASRRDIVVRVVNADGSANAQPYTFSTSHNNKTVSEPDAIEATITFNQKLTVDDAGVYDVVATDAAGAVVASGSLTLRLLASCVRCETARYDVSTPRVFGECEWRAHPLNGTIDVEIERAAEELGLTRVDDGYVPSLDDTFADKRDDESLLALETHRHEWRTRYFTYDAVLRLAYERNRDLQARIASNIQALIADATNKAELEELRASVVAARSLIDVPVSAVVKAATLFGASTRRFLQTIGSRLETLKRLAQRWSLPSLDVASAAQVRAHDVWAYVHVDFTPVSLFIDDVGEARLRARVATAARRYDDACRARPDDDIVARDNVVAELDGVYTDTVNVTSLSGMYDDDNAPLGVPLAEWEAARARGQRASEPARRCRADWRGIHSYTDKQPSAYIVGVQRGSERLGSGYDFAGLHARIEALGTSAEARKLATTFNVLARYAPALRFGHRHVSVDESIAPWPQRNLADEQRREKVPRLE